MNERIKELARQTEFRAVRLLDHYGTVDALTDSEQVELERIEKFAELIVENIGQIVSGLIVPETFEQEIGPYEHWNRALGTVALEIEQHFYGDTYEQ
jgi:hypothetical protein